MNLSKYILISLLIHFTFFSFLLWRSSSSDSPGINPGGISLSFHNDSGGGGKHYQPAGISGVSGSYNNTASGGGSSGNNSTVISRFVAEAYTNNPPEYPRVAKLMGYQGTVTLELEVMPDGTCGYVRMTRSSGYGILDNAAITAARQWVFFRDKALHLTTPVRVNQDIVFILNNY